MVANMGVIDRILRMAVALTIIGFLAAGAVHGWLAIVLGIVAVIMAITAIFGMCLLYALLGISTRGRQPHHP